MAAISDLFHKILAMLPFHSETLLADAKELVAEVEADVKKLVEDAAAEVRADVETLKSQVAGMVSAAEVSNQRQGVNQSDNTEGA